ncbi:MAG TPA: hypothetical protein VL403_08300 [Candidatus Kryptonia bacterium]|nr:hypothetical protein [Candidatus Kryptonia bacterium]
MERRQTTIAARCRPPVCTIALAVATALAGGAAHAGHLPRVATPLLLHLEGYVGAAPAGFSREAHLIMQYQGKDYEFDLMKMLVVTGDRSYAQVLQDVTPYRVNFILRGTMLSLAPLIGATAGQKLAIAARYRTGTRDLLIDAITPVSDPTPTPP